MLQQTKRALVQRLPVIIGWVVVLGVIIVGAGTYSWWLPAMQSRAQTAAENSAAHGHDHAGHDHAAHDHPGHDDASAIEISEMAGKNIGLTTGVIEPRSYVRTVSAPATVVERPGRSQIAVAAPLTGIVTRIYPIEGEAITPGTPLFDLRLTHEDLVTAQRDFLQSAQERDVATREIARLDSVGDGVIAGRRVLEQQYEKDKIEAAMHAQRQGLLLHGLSNQQIDEILQTRMLLPSLTIVAPPFDEEVEHLHEAEHLYHVQKIEVRRGQQVTAGDRLAMLADHCLLYVEGQAFEDDAERLNQVVRDQTPLAISPVVAGQRSQEQLSLPVLFVADHVDEQSRALRFYMRLPNQLTRSKQEDAHRFIAWKYRPGQRMEVQIPLGAAWENQIVLPPEAVVEEGTEAFVFEQNGEHFDRISVHVLYRDNNTVVVENNGALVGSTVAMTGAYDMHQDMKNKAGGGIDPHAGHNH